MDLQADPVSQEWPSTCTRNRTPPEGAPDVSLKQNSHNVRDRFEDQLQALRARSLERKLREISSAQGPEVRIGEHRLINFSSNDYLGLAGDSRLREAAIGAIEEFGVGAGASRLVSGTQSPHLRLENALAKW